jgi:23S rRNA pseudouridine955/2504/2580 synthase
MMVINKPAGLAVHGGSHLNYGLIEQLRQSRSNSGYLELVHRLDRGTSGILIIAKKASTLKNLQQQFATRQPQKTYLSLVKGKWNHTGQTVINKPLYKYLTPSGERRVTVVQQQDPKGKKAVTLVQPLQGLEIPYIGGCTLLQVVIKTGRTHQIRVHLAHQGYPILGDEKYGDFTLNRALQKGGYSYFGLHAWRLQVIHPNTREPLSLLAPLPQKWYPGIRSL